MFFFLSSYVPYPLPFGVINDWLIDLVVETNQLLVAFVGWEKARFWKKLLVFKGF